MAQSRSSPANIAQSLSHTARFGSAVAAVYIHILSATFRVICGLKTTDDKPWVATLTSNLRLAVEPHDGMWSRIETEKEAAVPRTYQRGVVVVLLVVVGFL